jgi:hypothetical protein
MPDAIEQSDHTSGFGRRFAEAIRRMDDANREDPRTDPVDGQPQPRELLFARGVFDWVGRLAPSASEALLLAARGHTVRRWRIPRNRYPKTTLGYHEWRDALAAYHADETAAILRDLGYPTETIDRVRGLILRKNWPGDPEACALEDADCLAFLQLKLARYLAEWGDDKTRRILKSTLNKMTEQGRSLAAEIPLGERERAILREAAANPPSR